MKKKSINISIATGVAILLFVGGVMLTNALFYSPSEEVGSPEKDENLSKIVPKNVAEAVENIKDNPLYPKRLSIPAIKVNAEINLVGITKKGNMATPTNFKDVGWYKYGPIPGEKGSALIAGHVNNGLSWPAVFGNLEDLKIGDDIYVERESGETIHFVVRSMGVYDFDGSTDEVFASSDEELLKLITCSGTWIPEYRTHDKRLVVTAEKAP
jgi:sortase A